MTRGRYPVVAIGEAQRRAVSWGLALIFVVTDQKMPFDFVINDRGCISLVRVRRLKYAGYGAADIARTCACEIAALRSLKLPDGICRELWVRGPDRTWHRYLVLPDGVEGLEKRDSGDGDDGLSPPQTLPVQG